jgi:hypothetical protein
MKTGRKKNPKKDIYRKYRAILAMPNLTDQEIDEMRKNLTLLAQTIYEHVWDKKFY